MNRRWIWAAWFGAVVITFAILEGLALSRPDGVTLSQTIVDLSHRWPPIVFLIGMGVGLLVSHFWWVWIPKQQRETCGICGKQILKEQS